MKKIQVAIAEDHDIVREGLISLLDGHELIKVAFDASDGKDLLDKLKVHKIDIVLLDLDMPIMSGREALEKIKQKYPKIRVIIISATFREPIIIEYIKKGVNAFLPKNCKFDKLVDTIKNVHEKGAFFDAEISMFLAKEVVSPAGKSDLAEFSDIELSILRLISKGMTSKETAEKLRINTRTVEWHRSQMRRKIGAENFSAVIAYAVQNNLVQVS